MKNYNAKTGKRLIQILMFSMYNDQRIIYREYIQNAYDSISRAVQEGILSEMKDGVVDINIDRNAQRITIRDNGIGIKSSEVAGKLLNIADSWKDGVGTAGQYGIGRLAGAGYCRVLKFKTSAVGEKEASILTFDVDFANQIINDATDTSSATEVIDLITKMEYEPEEESEHYFEVTLEGVYKEYKDLLSLEAITDYLRQVAPIDYSMEFKNILVASALQNHENSNYKDLWMTIKNVAIHINGGEGLRKRYSLIVEGTGDEVDSLDFFKIDNNDGEILAWGWYAVTPFTTQIPIADKSRGMRLRKHNIQLGSSDLLNKYFPENRGNNYFYGEVFVIHHNLRPNSDRSGLAPTPESERFFSVLRLKFKELHNLYHLANSAKNAVKKVTLAVDKLNAGVDNDLNHLQEDLKSAYNELEKIEGSDKAKSSVAQRVIDIHKAKAEKKKDDVKIKKKAPLSSYSTSSLQSNPFAVNSETKVIKESPVLSKGSCSDIYEPLKEKFTNKEITLIRRAFTYMNKACSEGHKEMLYQLQLVAIENLKSL